MMTAGKPQWVKVGDVFREQWHLFNRDGELICEIKNIGHGLFELTHLGGQNRVYADRDYLRWDQRRFETADAAMKAWRVYLKKDADFEKRQKVIMQERIKERDAAQSIAIKRPLIPLPPLPPPKRSLGQRLVGFIKGPR